MPGAGLERCSEWDWSNARSDDRSDARSGTGVMFGVGLERCPEWDWSISRSDLGAMPGAGLEQCPERCSERCPQRDWSDARSDPRSRTRPCEEEDAERHGAMLKERSRVSHSDPKP